MEQNIPYWFVILIISLLGFFLIRFWFLVDEIRKDVKQVLIAEAERKQLVTNIKEDIDEFKKWLNELQKTTNYHQREIERLKTNK